MEPLVSILIPAHNAEATLRDTLNSAIAQTWRRKEIILVDDGSSDLTLSVAKGFETDNVSVISQTNQGASAARNKAFAASQGDFIQWLDADDLLSRDKIERQISQLSACPSERTLLSSAWGHFYYRFYRADFFNTPLWCDLSPVEWLATKMGQNLHMQPATWLVSRKLTEAAGPWDVRLSLDDDGEYFCRVLLASDGTRFVPEAKTYYRMSSYFSLSKVDGSSKKLESQFLSMQLHIQYLLSLEKSDRTRDACSRYLRVWLPSFHPERPDLVSQLLELAATLGTQLPLPELSWKYAWIEKAFGLQTAKRSQRIYNQMKSSTLRTWDKALFQLNRRHSAIP